MADDLNAPQNPRIRVKYEELHARYASQVILNANQEEVFLDFSSGPVTDTASKDQLLPIHTRIAMTPAGVRRLLGALQQVLARQEASPPPVTAEKAQASLPKLAVS